MDREEEKLKELYEIAEKSEGTPPPKSGLFGSKCPQCGKGLSKDSAKKTIYSGEDGTDFAKRVTDKAGLPRGVYILNIKGFTCQGCGYDFAKVAVEELSD